MAVLIAGPTASGKSRLALRLAEIVGGTVINADSMQVYRGIRVVTARPTPEEEARVPHALYGFVDAAEAFSVAAWLDAARAAIAAARAAGRVPVLVGGTGLYLSTLTEGLSAIPPIPPQVRARWRAVRKVAPASLHAELAARDPVMAARLRPGDPQRLCRALEVIDATGRSLAAFQAERDEPVLAPGAGVVRAVIAPQRAVLRQRIADRLWDMIDAGALDEVAALVARRLDPQLPAMRAIGVAPLADHLSGRHGLGDAVAQAITDSRQYAKRQETWFRNRFAHWPRYATGEDGLAALSAALAGSTPAPLA